MDLRNPATPQDPLGEALHRLRMSGAFYCRSELTAPWGLALPPMPGCLWFHVVTSGGVWLERRAASRRCCTAATSRSSPTARGTGCAASRRAGAGILDLQREQVCERYEILRHGGGGARTRLMCGAVRFDHPAAHHLVEAAAADDPRRGVGLAGAGLDAEHAAADGRRGAGAAARRRGGHHAARRHPRHPGDPLVDRARPGGADRLARRAAGPADRPGDRAHPPRPGARLDRGGAGRRARHVALGLRRALHRAGRRAGDAVRHPLADARRARRLRGRGRAVGELANRLGYQSEAAFAARSSASSASRPARSSATASWTSALWPCRRRPERRHAQQAWPPSSASSAR